MHCNHCGCLLHAGEQFCPGCGRAIAPPPSAPVAAPPMYVAQGQPSGKATASLICGIFFFLLPAAVAAILLGHIAHAEIKRSGGRLIGAGRAMAGMILGYMGVATIPLILILAAIAIPNLLRARTAANEASAVGYVRMINTAELTYRSAYPYVGYACDLSQLGGNNANANSAGAGLIDDGLAAGSKHGYRFRVGGCAASSRTSGNDTYVVFAEPTNASNTGSRSFCSDQSGVIKFVSPGAEETCLQQGTPLQ
jgi:type IV pilus assembly protein PilA